MSEAKSGEVGLMPAWYIPHGGGPCFFMDWTVMGGPADTWDKTAAWLRALAEELPSRPKALLVISGHWEEAEFRAGSGARPDLIFDYTGFPPHTYRLTYPAPGDPELAEEVAGLLRAAGLAARTDPDRGFDHGVFIQLKLVFPDADIPIVTLSLKKGLDPAEHLAAGRALASLRAKGVMIVGSGMSYHNMSAFRSPVATTPSETFDAWLTEAVHDPAGRREELIHWADAPAARNAHPREEHLLPLMVAAGAAAEDVGEKVFSDEVMMARISGYRFG
ncbi:MAG: DODA-type extradiol aromatic ring-opening family dioxygenase [Caulobacteraceae bacterium]